MKKAGKQLADVNVYRNKDLKEELLISLAGIRNILFKNLKGKSCISDKSCEYFSNAFWKSTGRPVTSNYGAPTKKVSKFLDFHLHFFGICRYFDKMCR